MIEFISRLPQGYQEVEYIESSGTQYINTGVIPTVDTGVKVRGHFTSVQDADNIILGASDQTTFANGKPYSIDSFPDKVYVPFGGIVPDSTDTITTTQTKNKQYEYTLNYMDSGKASVDTLQITLPTRTSMTSNALYLFCLNGNGTAGYYSHFALEYLQITQGESVIHDYVPCYRKADNVAGLYDIATGTFLTNAGSGVFAVGADSNKHTIATIIPGGVISFGAALRRRMMIKCDSKIKFEYTGNYTDNRDANGIGTVQFTSSGTLTVLSGTATVSAYILGAGGGGAINIGSSYTAGASGGGGGYQTVEVDLAPSTYEIVIGLGGNAKKGIGAAGNGGDTVAFGMTSTGGKGGFAAGSAAQSVAGVGGSPNGNAGSTGGLGGSDTLSGGSPNGGSCAVLTVNSGGNGYVEITFS